MQTVNDAKDLHHAAANADFYSAMLSAHGSPQFIRVVRAYLEQLMGDQCLKPLVLKDGQPALPINFMAAYMTGAEIGVINGWLDNKLPVLLEEISGMVRRMCLFGISCALGLPINPNDIPT